MAVVNPEFTALIEHVVRKKLPVSLIDKKTQTVYLDLPGPLPARIHVEHDGSSIQLECICARDVPEERRAATLAFAARVNEKIPEGSFGLSPSGLLAIFRASRDLEGPPSDEFLIGFLGDGIETAARYVVPLRRAVDGDP